MTHRSIIVTLLLVFFVTAAAAQPKWVRERLAFEKACSAGDLAACTEAGWRLETGDNGPSGIREEKPDAAVPLYERACLGGSAPGCRRLAGLYEGGKGLAKNVRRAAMLYAIACDGNDAYGCFGAARIAETGAPADGLEREPERAKTLNASAVQLITAACDRGDGEACAQLGVNAFQGSAGVTRDVKRAVTLYERACELAYLNGCDLAGYIYAGTRGQEFADPVRWQAIGERRLRLQMQQCDAGNVNACATFMTNEGNYKGCEHGDPSACFQLGFSYVEGPEDRPHDAEKAAHFYIKGCDLGEPGMCTEAGDLFNGVYDRTGRELAPRDDARAAALYTRACAGGDREACQKLAAMASAGRGAKPNPARAAAVYRDGCDNGDTAACLALGRLAQRGEGVPRDPAQAMQRFDRACKLGSTTGCYEVALMHRDGLGVPANPALAKTLLREACVSNPYLQDSPLAGCREACAMNDGRSCATLARAAEQGSPAPDLQPKDAAPLYERAARFLETECGDGAAQSCYDLAQLHGEERPLRRDLPLRARLLDRSCTLGLGRGCESVATLYLYGAPPNPRDHTRAAGLFLKACDLGEPYSCEKAGEMAIAGDGVPRDEARGKELLRRAEEIKRKRGY